MFELSARAKDYLERTKKFIKDEIEPIETEFWREVHSQNLGGDWTKWQWPACSLCRLGQVRRSCRYA